MRWRLLLLVGGLAPLAGCHLTERAVHNAVNEPAMYLDEKHVTHQLRHEGKKVVKELRSQQAMSEDFEDGFVDGYADALERGGVPLPPAVPPTKYRRGRFLNPNGHARVYDYFAGFQQGAQCAAASGKRQFLTVPVLVADPPPDEQPSVHQVPKELCAPNANCPPPPVLVPPPGTLPTTTPPPADNPVAQKPAPPPAAQATKPIDTKPTPAKVPTDTELNAPKRPLIAAPLVPPVSGPEAPLPNVPRVAPEPSADRPGVVPPQPEPIVVVPPMPEPRK